jgi:enamine deaminase RidA (YjgF/YER057c/UK114 family)
MNYCNKISYEMLRAAKAAPFRQMAAGLLDRLPAGKDFLRLVFFGAPASEAEYLAGRGELKSLMAERFGSRQPAFSYVAQPPLDAPLTAEVQAFAAEASDKLTYASFQGRPYVLLENAEGRFLFAGGLQGTLPGKMEGQAPEVFRQEAALLAETRFPRRSVRRQWHYIEQITDYDGPFQHYQTFNNARTAFYEGEDWSGGYPAATGIGAEWGGLLVDFDAALFTSPEACSQAIDNPLQVAAHAYSASVLEAAASPKTTPKFERARSLQFGNRRLVYLSGTAAIRGEESLGKAGLERQVEATMENIARLTGDARLRLLRVYLKRAEDYAEARNLLNALAPSVPAAYMRADVCRPELRVEIEGIALQ